MGPRLVFSAGEVPEIPASRLSLIANAREPLLFWVHTGHAELQIGDRTRSVTAGAATWVPAGIAYSIRVDPGAVAFPIPMPAADLPPTLNRIIDFEIPAAWQDWLVHQFAHNLGFLRGGATVGAGLLELVAGAHSNDADASVSYAPPNLPRSAETLEIARTLLRTPADDTELSQFARQLKIGVRTLQRRFTEETGLPFARWRTSARIAAAIAYLNSGREIGWTGGQVGFATPAGFTRAFREHTGVTPSDYTRANQGSAPIHENETLAQSVATLVRGRRPLRLGADTADDSRKRNVGQGQQLSRHRLDLPRLRPGHFRRPNLESEAGRRDVASRGSTQQRRDRGGFASTSARIPAWRLSRHCTAATSAALRARSGGVSVAHGRCELHPSAPRDP